MTFRTRVVIPLLLVTAGIVGGVARLVYLGARAAQAAARKSHCNGNLCFLGLAMLEYHEKYGHFPPAFVADKDGRPMHSWRALLLEFTEPRLFKAYNFSEPWNSNANQVVARQMPTPYACPENVAGRAAGFTNYVVVVGKNTLFPEAHTTKLKDVPSDPGRTILLVEIADSDILWLEPRDLSFDSMSFELNDKTQPSIGSVHPGGANFCMADGTRRSLEVNPAELKRLMTIRRDEQ